MAEGARLESVYTATYRGFESLSLRHKQNPAHAGFFYGGERGLGENPVRQICPEQICTSVASPQGEAQGCAE